MTKEEVRGRLWIYLAVLLSAGHVALIWWYRFIPVYDYPNWLYQARILADLVKEESTFAQQYAIQCLPVPNATFSILVAILGQIFSFEVAGKILLTISVLLFPWGFWFASRRFGAKRDSAVLYMGFPFAVTMFALNAQNYTLALGMLFWFLGLFMVTFHGRSRTIWVLMSASICLIFLTHGAIYGVLVVLLINAALTQPWGTRMRIGMTLVPSVALAVWHVAVMLPQPSDNTVWGTITFARHFVKPLCIFLKSYGIAPPFPPTYLNVAWMAAIGLFALVLGRGAVRSRSVRWWIAGSGGVLMLLALFLPDPALGMAQPGARFMFPAAFLLLLSVSAGKEMRGWHLLILGSGFVALLYNFAFFRSFDNRAAGLTVDLHAIGVVREPVYIIGLDWDVGADASSRIAPSINAMSFVPLYTFSERGITYSIFETGLVRMKDTLRSLYPVITGSDLTTWFALMFSDPARFVRFRSILVFGDGLLVEEATNILRDRGFMIEVRRPGWRILVRE